MRLTHDPRQRPPLQLGPLLDTIAEHDVTWVLSGSLVLVAHGARLTPHDLDLVPSLDEQNLARLVTLLADLDSVPAYSKGWESGPTLEECRAWVPPDPPTAAGLDHLYVTRLGMLDIPPRLTGDYEHLRAGATLVELAGREVLACDPREVLDRLPDKLRSKDRDRATAYADLRARLGVRPPSD